MIVVWVVVDIMSGWGEPVYAHRELPFLSVPRIDEMVEIGGEAFYVDSISHMPREQRIAIIIKPTGWCEAWAKTAGAWLKNLGFAEGLPPWSKLWRNQSAAHATGLSSSTGTKENATPLPANPDSA